MDRPTLAALVALIAIPGYAIPTTFRDAGRGREVQAAPRQTAVVRNKWVEPAGRYTRYWVRLEVPGGAKWDMPLPGTEWGLQRVGAPMTVAMLAGGKPMSVNAGVDPSNQWPMLAVEGMGFVAAAGFLGFRLFEGRGRVSDLSPEAELARRAEKAAGAPPQRPVF